MDCVLNFYFLSPYNEVEKEELEVKGSSAESIALIIQHAFERGINFEQANGPIRRHIPANRILEIRTTPV